VFGPSQRHGDDSGGCAASGRIWARGGAPAGTPQGGGARDHTCRAKQVTAMSGCAYTPPPTYTDHADLMCWLDDAGRRHDSPRRT